MNIFIYEFKMYVKSVLAWSISIMALLTMFMAFYPTFGSDVAIMDKILENYPKELLKIMGMNTGMSLSSVLGYFVFVFVFIQLCIAIQASNYGFSFLSVEERELTADFLMSKPVSRSKILVSKFLAALLALTITNAVLWITSFTTIAIFSEGKDYNINNLILLLLTIGVFQLFFMSIGMIISVSVKKIRSVLSFSMALSFGLYILNALRNIFGGELLGILTPFYHFEPGYILEKGQYNLPLVFISIGIIIISIVATYILYLKRNIHTL